MGIYIIIKIRNNYDKILGLLVKNINFKGGKGEVRNAQYKPLITGPYIVNHLIFEQKDHEGALQGDS